MGALEEARTPALGPLGERPPALRLWESEEEILKDRFLNPPPLKKVSDPGLFDYSLVRNTVGFPVVMDYPNRTRTPSGNKVKFSVENINEEDLQEVCINLCKKEFFRNSCNSKNERQ